MNPDSLAARVTRVVGLTVAGALTAAGLVTAVLVWEQQRAALDRELRAAVQSFGESGSGWEVEHRDGRVRVWEARIDELPKERTEDARDRERPVVFDLGGERVMLLVSEREEDVESDEHAEGGSLGDDEVAEHEDEREEHPLPGEDGLSHHRTDRERPDWKPLPRWDARRAAREGGEVHRLVAAAAPRIQPWTAVGSFLAAYAAASLVVAGLAALSLGRLARIALSPLDQARRAADSAAGAAHGVRLAEDGPDEVRGLIAAMNALLTRMDAAAAAQSRFTAEAAHELRTPLTVLLGELELALRRPRDAASLTETIRSAREEALRLAELVEGLLTLARVDAGQAEQGREIVRIGEIVDMAVVRERGTLTTAGCELEVELREDVELEGHRALLAAALANLLRNAAVHAPGAPVRLTVDRGRGRARVIVEDGGPGIVAAEREAVFDRLSRGGTARRRSSGLGLGLPLAREIARRHGGDCVIADSERGCRVEWWV